MMKLVLFSMWVEIEIVNRSSSEREMAIPKLIKREYEFQKLSFDIPHKLLLVFWAIFDCAFESFDNLFSIFLLYILRWGDLWSGRYHIFWDVVSFGTSKIIKADFSAG